jgi:5-oxoprolinase (ATP-hydrolysing)
VRQVETTDSKKSDRQLTGSTSTEEDAVYQERRINMGGKNTAAMKAGERIIIHTPGGGGWGKVEDRKDGKVVREKDPKHAWRGGSHASREELALQA